MYLLTLIENGTAHCFHDGGDPKTIRGLSVCARQEDGRLYVYVGSRKYEVNPAEILNADEPFPFILEAQDFEDAKREVFHLAATYKPKDPLNDVDELNRIDEYKKANR